MKHRHLWTGLVTLIAASSAVAAILLLRPDPATDLSRTEGAAAGGQSVTIPAHAFDPHIVQISAGSNHTLALADDGTVYAWGENNRGQLGDGTTTDAPEPHAVPVEGTPMDGTHITQVSAGTEFSVALAADGRVFAWGDAWWGRIGNGADSGRSRRPVQVSVPGTPMDGAHIVEVAAGVTHTLARSSEGELFGWGSDQHWRLGRTGSMANVEPVAPPSWRCRWAPRCSASFHSATPTARCC